MVYPFGSMSCLQPSLASLSHAQNLEITILIPNPALPQQLPLLGVAIKPDQKSQAGVAWRRSGSKKASFTTRQRSMTRVHLSSRM